MMKLLSYMLSLKVEVPVVVARAFWLACVNVACVVTVLRLVIVVKLWLLTLGTTTNNGTTASNSKIVADFTIKRKPTANH